MTLSTKEIEAKCKEGRPGVCDKLSGHDGPHIGANGVTLSTAAVAERKPGKASPNCQSGGRDGCTCDACW